MVCCDKSFFKLNTKRGKRLWISPGPAAGDACCFLADRDGRPSTVFYHLNRFPTIVIVTVS